MDTLVFNKIYFYRFPRIFVQNFPIQFYPGRPYSPWGSTIDQLSMWLPFRYRIWQISLLLYNPIAIVIWYQDYSIIFILTYSVHWCHIICIMVSLQGPESWGQGWHGDYSWRKRRSGFHWFGYPFVQRTSPLRAPNFPQSSH